MKVRVCPSCLELDIDFDWRQWQVFVTSVPIYHCNSCNYTGPVILEMEWNEWRRLKEDSILTSLRYLYEQE